MAYRITFTRYLKDSARRQISDAVFFSANPYIHNPFSAAYDHAFTMLVGMRAVDPDNEYEIASISNDGLSGQQCRSLHGGIWGVPKKVRVAQTTITHASALKVQGQLSNRSLLAKIEERGTRTSEHPSRLVDLVLFMPPGMSEEEAKALLKELMPNATALEVEFGTQEEET